jgi:pimeloyl-ACP methyl ester carboxylesterase
MGHQVLLLPGIVTPAELAYADLLTELGSEVDARAKELEVYADQRPPDDYGLPVEIAGVLRAADEAGVESFHLVGYSGGGAISAALAALHPDRLLSLTLMEPAWVGNEGRSAEEDAVAAQFDQLRRLPPEEMMSRFVRLQLAPGVEPPASPPGPPPAWMAKRPAGIGALTAAFEDHDLELAALGRYRRPVLYVLGGRSNPRYFRAMADRLAGVFPDYTIEVFARRHHFDPPHRAEPQRLATRLIEHWDRATILAS